MLLRMCGFLMLTCLLGSCAGDVVFEKYFELPSAKWDYDQAINFEVDVKDVKQTYDLYVNVRHTNDYAYSNLWMMLYSAPQEGEGTQQRMELKLAMPNGAWLGKGFGSTVTHEIKVRSNIRFENPGVQLFTLQHDMRINPVPALSHVGIRLERSKGQ